MGNSQPPQTEQISAKRQRQVGPQDLERIMSKAAQEFAQASAEPSNNSVAKAQTMMLQSETMKNNELAKQTMMSRILLKVDFLKRKLSSDDADEEEKAIIRVQIKDLEKEYLST